MPPERTLPESPPQAETTASGLDERGIDPQDMEQLRGQFRFSSVALETATGLSPLTGWQLPAGLDKAQLHSAQLGLPAAGAQRVRLVPLPGKVRTHALRLDAPRTRVRRDLAPALAQPVRRPRVQPGELTPAEQDAVNKAVVAKYGSAARNLTLAGVFREVPPEAAKSVRLDEALRFCQFTLPPGTNVARLQRGYALVIATGESGKTYPALARL